MNHCYQVIRSEKTFTIHEYLFGIRSTNSTIEKIEDLNHHMRKIPPHFKALVTIRGTDRTVRDASDYKNTP